MAEYRRREPKRAWATAALHNSRRRASERNIPWALTREAIESLLTDSCPALGIGLKYEPGPLADNSPTLDRRDPSRGYLPDNIVVLSSLANRIKTNATAEQVRAVLVYMENNPQ